MVGAGRAGGYKPQLFRNWVKRVLIDVCHGADQQGVSLVQVVGQAVLGIVESQINGTGHDLPDLEQMLVGKYCNHWHDLGLKISDNIVHLQLTKIQINTKHVIT